jgi:hypothetical protein
VRAGVHACKLECRLDEDATKEEIAACKRHCVARGIKKAHDVCKLGRPTCVRLCHPESCRKECGLEPAADLEGTAKDDGVCEPPIDRECLGACGRDLRKCAAAVVKSAEQCLTGCKELHGLERYECVRECADDAIAGGRECKRDFRACVVDCGVEAEPEPSESPDVP